MGAGNGTGIPSSGS
jgi:hypothetical protein